MFPYIIKATICLVLLLGFYHFVLEKEKMHRFNRFYLISAIIFSFIVPSFIITVAPVEFIAPILDNSEFVSQVLSIETSTIQAAQEIDYTNYFIGLYILISAILLLILTKKITQILVQTRRNKKVSYFSATVVLLKEQIVPYSFLQYIFLNKFTYQTNTIEQQILTHELAHVQQKHSLDVLFIEVLQNLFWFNPIFRYYKKAIQLNHEFLADDAVIQSHKNISEYQYLLLNTTAQQNNIYLASNFNYSLTKKRLLMMTKPSSKTKILLKKLLVLPLIAGFIFAFAQRVEAQEKLPQVVEVLEKTEEGISKNEMNEYKELFTKAKNDRLYIYKHLVRMKDLYRKMSTEQQNSVEDIYKIAPPQPQIIRENKTPTTTQFNSWKNKKKFALWIDGKVADNSVLNKYTNTDFSYFTGSKVYKNARSKRFPQEFQFQLYTKSYYAKMKVWEKEKSKNTIRIQVGKDGNININDSYTSFINDLAKNLDKLNIDKKKAHIAINYHAKVEEKHLIQLKNSLRKYGIYKLSFHKNAALFATANIYNLKVKEIEKSKTYKKSQLDFLKRLYNSFNDQERAMVKKPSLIKLPPKPQIIEVVDHYNNDTYKHLNESYEKLRNKKPHYVKSSKKRQQNLDFLFSKLGSTYFKLSKADKRKVKRPVHPHYPYIRLKKNGTIFYKLKSELTAEDKKLLPLPPPKPRIKEVKPVSIKVIEKANSNELIEVIEEKEEVVEQKELIEIEEVAEEKEKIEVIEDRASSNQWVEFVEILQSAPGKIDVNSIPPPPSLKVKATEEEINRYQKAYAFWKKNKQKPKSISKSKRIKTLLNYISKLDKRDAKFTYNKKNISYKKAQYLISKKNIHNIHANENNDKTIVVKLSAKPFVIETAK